MKREITVYCLAQTRVNLHHMQDWLSTIGAEQFSEDLTNQVRSTPPIISDADTIVGVAAKRCYNSFEVGLNPNVSRIRKDWAEYLDNVMKSGHGSVTEHASWTWAIEGCTRVLTAEGNRHRAGVAISEASLRYIRFGDDIPYWEPLSIRPEPGEEGESDFTSIQHKKAMSRAIFADTFEFVQESYRKLEKIWADELNDPSPSAFTRKKQLTSMFRRIVPMGVSVGVIYTLNMRALRHIMTMRCSPAAEEEIAYAFGLIAKEMCDQEPKLFGDFVNENGYWRPKYVKI